MKQQSERLKRIGMEPENSTVEVELVVTVTVGTWGPECTIGQAIEQATTEARQVVYNALKDRRDISVSGARVARVVTVAKKEV